MKYKVTYRRRADRNQNKWTTFTEVLRLKEMYDLLKWLEKYNGEHELISVVPV